MRRITRRPSSSEIFRVLSLIALFATGSIAGALLTGTHVAYAKGGGGKGGGGGEGRGGGNGGGGSGGNGAGAGAGAGGAGTGTGGTGAGPGGVDSGTGAGSGGTGAGAGGSGGGIAASSGGHSSSGAGAQQAGTTSSGDGRGSSGSANDDGNGGFLGRLARGIGLTTLFASAPSAVPPPMPPVAALSTNWPPIQSTGVSRGTAGAHGARLSRSAPSHRETQSFQFEVGATVFPTTGGVVTTEAVDGVDVVTVDALHRRTIHPAAFFEPHEGAQFDRRSVERIWPLEIGKTVHFLETAGSQRWLNVLSVSRVETVGVPAGVFRAFVVERTVTSMAPGPRPVVIYTYWYAPDAGTIVKSAVKSGGGKPVTDEADVLGYPLSRPSTASVGSAD